MKIERYILIFVLCTWFLCPLRAQELLDYPLDTINGVEVYRYEVEKSIGLYRISVNFNVTQEDIIRFNPELRERGLHYGETIFLPTGRKVEKAEKREPKPERLKPGDEKPFKVVAPVGPKESDVVVLRSDTVIVGGTAIENLVIDSMALDTLAVDSLAPDTLTDERPFIELALMLPFESRLTKRSANADRMLEFYQGALFALRDLRNDSVRYRLRVYDTERSERRISELCDSTELDSVQGILGLVYPVQIERMAAWCHVHDVPLLLPFSDDADLQDNPNILQFNSTDLQEADSLCGWIESHDVHCVAVEAREADVNSSIRTLRKELKRRGINCSTLALHDLMIDSVAGALDKSKENLFILHSERFQHIRILLPHLAKLQDNGYRVRLVSQYSWQKESIGVPQVYTSIFTAGSDCEAYDAQWLLFFGREHVSEAPRYDLLGYDLMNALIQRAKGASGETAGLQSDIRWQQVENGGWQNANVKVIER